MQKALKTGILSLFWFTLITISALANAPTHAVDGDYIQEWLVLGPFDSDGTDAENPIFVPNDADPSPVEGRSVLASDGTTRTWQRYTAKGIMVSLIDAIADHENATAYAFCFLRSEVAGEAQLHLAGSGVASVWIRGVAVLADTDIQSTLDSTVLDVNLSSGLNPCLIRLGADEQG